MAKLETDVNARRVYVLTNVGSQPIIITFLLYAVINVEPALADVGGGTELTITSEGITSGCVCGSCSGVYGLPPPPSPPPTS